MIQRIQSVYLFLTTLLAVLFLSGSIISFTGPDTGTFSILFSGIYNMPGGKGEKTGLTLFLSIPAVAAALLSLTAIFLYKRRQLQLIITKVVILTVIATAAAMVYYVLLLKESYVSAPDFSYKFLIPPVQVVLLILAHRAITSDEKLVRSYDRLR